MDSAHDSLSFPPVYLHPERPKTWSVSHSLDAYGMMAAHHTGLNSSVWLPKLFEMLCHPLWSCLLHIASLIAQTHTHTRQNVYTEAQTHTLSKTHFYMPAWSICLCLYVCLCPCLSCTHTLLLHWNKAGSLILLCTRCASGTPHSCLCLPSLCRSVFSPSILTPQHSLKPVQSSMLLCLSFPLPDVSLRSPAIMPHAM